MKHSSSGSRRNIGGHSYLGENLAFGITDAGAVDAWYSEIKDTPGGKGLAKSFNDGGGKPIGHYTQVVWKGSTALGCAVNGRLIVCQYKGGNMGGQFSSNVLAPSKSKGACGPDGSGGGDVLVGSSDGGRRRRRR